MFQENERYEEAMEVLKILHVSPDGHGMRVVNAEMALIKAQIEAERVRGSLHDHSRTEIRGLTKPPLESIHYLLAYLQNQVAPKTSTLLHYDLGSLPGLWCVGHCKSDPGHLRRSWI